MTYISELILILVSDLYLFRSPVGVTELMLIQRYLNTYWYLYLSQISRRIQITDSLYGSTRRYDWTYTYSCISDLIRVLRNLYLYKSTRKYYTYSLYGGTRRYYWTYIYITELILILPIRKYP